ncbi:hypothetical protein EDB85DRAFT_392455 [Lactarius pseudohatsudake]|nr:hypothetical protein EDB85DRAFT_392455 [Lactarius pseudohatsudake]
MALTLLDIPPELIVSIILCLSPHDIMSCQGTCRTLCGVCKDTALRYLVELERHGVSDDLRPGISYPERLLLLQRREEAWANLDFRKSVQVTVPFESTGIYDFTGGAFLLGTRLHSASRRPTIGYSYLTPPSLSSTDDQKLKWQEISLGIQILDVGMAVHEHDLIAALTARPDKNGPIDRHHTLEIRLLSFSTGQPHPLAEQPIIFIASISLILGHCNVLIEVVGEYLALLITFPWRDTNEDMFFLLRWKMGEAHYLRSSEWGAYSYFSFLTEDTLVIPNLLQNTLEIVRIVVDGSDDDVPRLVPLCTLGLPPLVERASIVRLACRAEPNPTGSDPPRIPPPSSRPFRDKAADAIVLFNLLIEDANPHPGHFQFPETRPFAFVVHRRALLALIPPAQRACAPFRSAPATAPTQVPWSAWGVPATRWFESDPASMRWITTTSGQRAVTMEERSPTPIIVRDFNSYAVRAALAREATQWGSQEYDGDAQQLPNGNRRVLEVAEAVILAGTVFREDVRSALPYIETVTQKRYRYEGVLIDEERILGLETTCFSVSQTSKDDEIEISSFDVHVLG